MSAALWPQAPFHPGTSPIPPTGAELWAGPIGLLGLIPLVPLIRVVARWSPRAALLGAFLVWTLATAGPSAAAIVICWAVCGHALVCALLLAERDGRISRRTRVALVWTLLHLLILPLWWFPVQPWAAWDPACRFSPLHALGFAYMLVRLIAWGVSADCREALRSVDTACWLFYPPASRNGPVLLRGPFLERFDAWRPAQRPDVRAVLRRMGAVLVGLLALGIVTRNIPEARLDGDICSTPALYSTGSLIRVLYLVPTQIYLALWTYSELANALGLWIGVHVEENFNFLPATTSVRDFWRRWHISLGAWLRDYMYIPLGGNRRRTELNYFIIFVYVGLWHGASWSYAAWGVTQGLGLSVNRWWDRWVVRSGRPAWTRSWPWRVVCWLLTIHYQAASITLMWDPQHCGTRYFPELLRRIVG
ncbi:MAG: MBOAT family O-acyltransferase [Phycisphaerae bacterium]